MPEPQGTYTIRQFQLVGGATPLTPFTSSTSGTPYTSDSSRSLAPFGYSYPEIIDWNQTLAQLKITCTTHLNRLYNADGSFFKTRKRNSAHHRRSVGEGLSLSSPCLKSHADTKMRTWIVSVGVSKFDYASAFIVRVFMGEPRSAPSNWFNDENSIGSLFVQQPTEDTAAFYRQQGRDVVVHDEFDVEDSLWSRGLDGQDVEKTKEFLTSELSWKVQTVSIASFLLLWID